MRTNNNKAKNVIISVYFVLIILAILSAVMFRMFSPISSNPLVVFLIIALSFSALFYVVHTVSKFFEYDSDGMKVVVTNRGLLMSERFNYREHTIEFTKEDLVGFKFHNFIVFNSLVFLVKDKRGNTQKERFNVTLVSKKKKRYIRQSLTKMIKKNSKEGSS